MYLHASVTAWHRFRIELIKRCTALLLVGYYSILHAILAQVEEMSGACFVSPEHDDQAYPINARLDLNPVSVQVMG